MLDLRCTRLGYVHKDVEAKVPSWGASLHYEIRGNGPDKPTKVEDRRQPGVLLAGKIEIISKAEDRSVG